MPKYLLVLLLPFLLAVKPKPFLPDSKRAADVRAKVWPQLQSRLKKMGLLED